MNFLFLYGSLGIFGSCMDMLIIAELDGSVYGGFEASKNFTIMVEPLLFTSYLSLQALTAITAIHGFKTFVLVRGIRPLIKA